MDKLPRIPDPRPAPGPLGLVAQLGGKLSRNLSRFWVHSALGVLLLFALVPSAPALEKVAICHASLAAALVPVAKMQRYFAAEGLEVDALKFPSGFQALQAMLDGKCALSTAAVPPVTYQSQRRNDFRILAAISNSGNFERILMRRDKGLRGPADLRGRRVAMAEGTSAHYFFDTYLAVQGMVPDAATKVFLPAHKVTEAFRHGEVDAAAHWEPHILELANEFGDRAQVLSSPGLVVSPFLLLVREDFTRAHPDTLKAILSALIKAELFSKKQPAQTKAILASHFGMTPQQVEYTWALHDFRVFLNQPLLLILENVALWQARQTAPGRQAPPRLPNFLDFVLLAPLKAVAPDAVTILD